MYPVPEDSGGETGSSAADLVEDSALTAGEGKQVTWFKVSSTGGFRSTGARGNRFTWFEVSGTGGFRSTDLEAGTGGFRCIYTFR